MGTYSSSSQKSRPNTKNSDPKVSFRSQRDIVIRGRNSSKIIYKSDTKSRTKSEASDAASCVLKNGDLVIDIMKFLGVRSVVAFGLCSKSLRDGLGMEIKRRKKVFADCKNEVKGLLKNMNNPSRTKILNAKRIMSTAERMVDDELDFLHIPRQRFLSLPRYPFMEEAKLFFPGNPEGHDLPEFHMLPICFFLAKNEGSLFVPTKQELWLAIDRALNIVDLQDHFRCQMVRYQTDPYYGHPKYPFRKFEHSRANFFRKIMLIAANSLKHDIRAREAFRIAARKLVLSRPYAQDCLHFVLHSADFVPHLTEV